jgi:glycosyltransferase involved in cell wall biosynthesis
VNPVPPIQVAQIVTRCIAGAGGVALRGALHLDPSRYQVTMVTGEGGPLTERATAGGIRVVIEPSLVSPISPWEDSRAFWQLRQICERERFDVVHTHSAKAGVLGRLAAHRAGVPAIVHTYHGFPFHQFQSPLRRSSYVAVERRLARITDVVLAVGTGVATEALRRGLARPSALRTVAPVVDARCVRRDVQSTATARRLLDLDDEAAVVGTVGRIDYQKAPEHLVEAAALMRHTDAHVVWVGSGPGIDDARAVVRAHALDGRFHFVGERSDVADLLPAFDVFAMSSRYEGLPCAVVEAMRCGLPVVATAVNSVPDLVVPGESGILVPPADPRAMADALDSLLDDPALAGRLGVRGQQLAGRPFDAESLAGVLDEVYGAALATTYAALAG